MDNYDQIINSFSSEEQLHVLKAMASQYFSAYLIDLNTDTYKEITASNHAREKLSTSGTSENGIEQFTRAIVDPSDYEMMKKFVDKDTIRKRMRVFSSLYEDYRNRFNEWSRAVIIPISFNEDGTAHEVFLGTYTIDDFKRKFIQNEIAINDREAMVTALSSDYSTIIYADINKNLMTPIRISPYMKEHNEFVNSGSFGEFLNDYINKTVLKDDREYVRNCTSKESIVAALKNSSVLRIEYRVVWDGIEKDHYYQMKIVKLNDDNENPRITLAILDVDSARKETVEQYAYFDSLTGGYNYHRFKEKLSIAGEAGYLAIMNIHSFRIINSVCGTVTGDNVIKEIWACIEEMLKNSLRAHIYADSFALYIKSEDRDEIRNILLKLSEEVHKISKKLSTPQLNAYFGLSKFSGTGSPEDCINEANTALKFSHDHLTEPIAFYKQQDADKVLQVEMIESSFEYALAQDEFKVWFQPKYNALNGKIVGAEALCRWVKSDGKIISPGIFVPIFEGDGFIRILDEHVFRKVCELQSKRLKQGKMIFPISVNLSRSSLYYPEIVDIYKSIISEYGVGPAYMPLEITESATIESDLLKDVTRKFRDAGFPLYMDDFGAGYSSLGAITEFDYETIKIDKKLVDHIGQYSGERLLTHTISFIKELGIRVVAEGVETKEQADFLRMQGCDFFQGYYFSKPLPEKEFAELIDKC